MRKQGASLTVYSYEGDSSRASPTRSTVDMLGYSLMSFSTLVVASTFGSEDDPSLLVNGGVFLALQMCSPSLIWGGSP